MHVEGGGERGRRLRRGRKHLQAAAAAVAAMTLRTMCVVSNFCGRRGCGKAHCSSYSTIGLIELCAQHSGCQIGKMKLTFPLHTLPVNLRSLFPAYCSDLLLPPSFTYIGIPSTSIERTISASFVPHRFHAASIQCP